MAKEFFKVEPHTFDFRVGGRLYCHYCGLIALNNEFTQWSIKQGCNHRDHPQYQAKRDQLTKLQ